MKDIDVEHLETEELVELLEVLKGIDEALEKEKGEENE